MGKTVGKKVVEGGERVSSQVLAFLEQQQQQHEQQQQPPPSRAAAAISSGFVPRTEETDRQKEAAKTWDASQVLKVDDADAQVQIFNAYSRGANTNLETGASSKRGLGLGAEDAPGARPAKRFMSFVAAEGQAPAAAAQPAASAAVA